MELIDDIPDFVLTATSGPHVSALVLKVKLEKLLGPNKVELTVGQRVHGYVIQAIRRTNSSYLVCT